MNTEIVILTICTHYACALINGDNSGLNDEDIELIDEFSKQWYVESCLDEEAFFARDEISGLMANCERFCCRAITN